MKIGDSGSDFSENAKALLVGRVGMNRFRPLLAILALGTIAVLLWAIVFKSPETIHLQGVIEPGYGSFEVRAERGSVVEQVLVADGATVSKGDTLIVFRRELDDEVLKNRYQNLELINFDIKQIQTLADGESPAIEDSLEDEKLEHALLYAHQMEAHRSAVLEADNQVLELTAQARVFGTSIKAFEARAASLQETLESFEALLERGLVARPSVLELRRERDLALSEASSLRLRETAMLAEIEGARARRLGIEATWKSQLLIKLGELKAERRRLEDVISSDEELLRSSVLRAEQPGVVYGIVPIGRGSVVAQNQRLMFIAPSEPTLTFLALAPPSTVGFIQPGQRAQVELMAFPFPKFSRIDATIASVLPETVDTTADQAGRFRVRLCLEAEATETSNATLPIKVGMIGSAKVEIGKNSPLEKIWGSITGSEYLGSSSMPIETVEDDCSLL